MNELAQQLDSLDTELFSFVEMQGSEWDRQALLALEVAAGELCAPFTYLEIGSYLGGSLQVVLRDPRCCQVISIDSRVSATPDVRGGFDYGVNTTERMLGGLRRVPGIDLDKLITIDASTTQLIPSDLPSRPTYCFVDGEHTYDAVLQDAQFCVDALDGRGVIAFHDYVLVGSAIRAFLRENWREISYAVAFSGPSHPSTGGGVLSVELGGLGLLKHPAVVTAIASKWHHAVWRSVNRSRRSALPFLIAWAALPALDSFLVNARHGLDHYVRP